VNPETEDFHAECVALKSLLDAMVPAAFALPTAFKDWSSNDILRHLLRGNHAAVLSLDEPDAFAAFHAHALAIRAAGDSMRDEERRFAADAAGPPLAARWMESVDRIVDRFGNADLSTRVDWGGRRMSARSSISARFMENWAHSQAIYDLLGVHRREADRIRAVAILGFNTYAWTFENRGEPVPGPLPRVELTSPSGATWQNNADTRDSSITGPAVDFCRVVTQVRNVLDTALEVRGEAAERWMAIAQCFAGPPHPPPPAGARQIAIRRRADLLLTDTDGMLHP
jgi:uncharacterized protein (TIGR03084 family)